MPVKNNNIDFNYDKFVLKMINRGYNPVLKKEDIEYILVFLTDYYTSKISNNRKDEISTLVASNILDLLNGYYRDNIDVIDDDKSKENIVFTEILSSDNLFNFEKIILGIDKKSGIVVMHEGVLLETVDGITIEQLYDYLISFRPDLDLENVKTMIISHEVDLELKKFIINTVAQNIISKENLSSEDKILNYNMFILDFNNNEDILSVNSNKIEYKKEK